MRTFFRLRAVHALPVQNTILSVIFVSILLATTGVAQAASTSLKVGDEAPAFSLADQDGKAFSLVDRKGKGWTVLYFYPKADTPGCTKQACAFRDSIKQIREQSAEIYGVSVDSVADQKKFHEKHKINFPLLCDEKGEVAEKFGVKMPVIGIAKRWTFVIDPDLKIRNIDKDVDPAMDAKKTAKLLETLQATPASPSKK
jgi:peroxiredoxin Q/BCP